MTLSVNISRNDRRLIVQKAQAAYFKTAGKTDPNTDLRKIITSTILINRLHYIAERISEEHFKYIKYIPTSDLAYLLTTLKLDSEFAIKNAALSGDKLITSNRYLEKVSFDDLNIPDKFICNGMVMFPFEEFGVDIKLEIEDSIKNKITAHNEQIDNLLGDMDASLANLTNSINACKTTKAYEKKLPNLTSLYPDSLVRKLKAKNETEEIELSEEDMLLRKASIVIATSRLMEE